MPHTVNGAAAVSALFSIGILSQAIIHEMLEFLKTCFCMVVRVVYKLYKKCLV